jgi:predicted nucleotidyltransferase
MAGRNGEPKKAKVNEIINRIVERIRLKYRPDGIILFGSHAYGRPDTDSDIDLLIIKRTRKPFHERYAEVGGMIRDVRRGWAVSPFVISPSELQGRLDAGDQFITEVISRGKWLYGRKGIAPAG